ALTSGFDFRTRKNHSSLKLLEDLVIVVGGPIDSDIFLGLVSGLLRHGLGRGCPGGNGVAGELKRGLTGCVVVGAPNGVLCKVGNWLFPLKPGRVLLNG